MARAFKQLDKVTITGELLDTLVGAGKAIPLTPRPGSDAVAKLTFRRSSGTGAYDLRTADDGAGAANASAKQVDADVAWSTGEISGDSVANLRLYVPAATVVEVTADIAGAWS